MASAISKLRGKPVQTQRKPAPRPKPKDRKPNVQERIRGSTQTQGLRNRLSRILGERVVSAHYVGKDKAGRPLYRIAYAVGANYPDAPAGRGTFPRAVTVNKLIALEGDRAVSPLLRESALTGMGGPGGTDPRLAQAKDNWLKWIAQNTGQMLTEDDARGLVQIVSNWTGSSAALDARMRFISKNFPLGPGNIVAEEEETYDPFAGIFDFLEDIGGGAVGPEYRAPDRRVVEDFVKGAMVSLIGTIADHRLEEAVDLYMKDHRRNFDSVDQEIDPAQSVLEYLRNTEEYQHIHALRPESEDERDWVSQRRVAAGQGGLNVGLQEDFAIEQAIVGGDLPDVAEAATIEQFMATGSARGTLLEDRIRNLAQNFFRGVI